MSGSLARHTFPLWCLLGLSGCGSLDLSVAANPNSVLTAVATVSWSQAKLSTVSITAQAAGGPALSTPALKVSGSTPMVIPVLPLKASTTYTLHASGKTLAGYELASKDVSFTTGKLPPEAIPYTVAPGGTPSAGYTLLATQPLPGTAPPQYLPIVDSTGETVWYYESTPICGGDFQQQPDGSFTIAVLDPTHTIPALNEALTVYRQIDVLGNTLKTWTALDVPTATPPIVIAGTDSHDIRIQPNGDALLFGLVEETNVDLTQFGGQPGSTVVGNVFERVTANGAVTFSWNAFDHLSFDAIDKAAAPLTSPVDFTHANSIDVFSDGNYLLGMRDLSQVFKIDSTTGEIIWTLGGSGNTDEPDMGPMGDFKFVDDPLGGFSCQHGARVLPNGHILMLDDGNGHTPQQSRAVEYALDTTAMTATLVWSSQDTPSLFTHILGYAQRLTNGNTLVAYGQDAQAGQVQEVDPTGKNVLWDLMDPQMNDFGVYRAYRLDPLAPMALTGG